MKTNTAIMADYYNNNRLDYKLWKTTIDIFKDENLVLKNSMVSLFQTPLNRENLEEAEQLQSRLLIMDESLRSLENKIQLFSAKLNVVSQNNFAMRLQSQRRHKNLKLKVELIQEFFLALKSDVDKFKQSIKRVNLPG